MESSTIIMFAPDRRPRPDHERHGPACIIHQAAAICLRVSEQGDGFELLLVASSRTGQWGLPKGHVEPGETSWQTAAREAHEEAGIEGRVTLGPCGAYSYRKPNRTAQYRVNVHSLMVSGISQDYAERGMRLCQWVPLAQADAHVSNPDLVAILKDAYQSQNVRIAAQ